MPDEPDYLEIASTIVAAYLRRNPVAADQLHLLITAVHQALTGLGKPAQPVEGPLTPAVPIRRSVERDFVVCLDCGYRGLMLRRHLRLRHQLTPEQSAPDGSWPRTMR